MDCPEIDFVAVPKTDSSFSCGVKVRHVLCPTVVAIVEGLASLGQVATSPRHGVPSHSSEPCNQNTHSARILRAFGRSASQITFWTLCVANHARPSDLMIYLIFSTQADPNDPAGEI